MIDTALVPIRIISSLNRYAIDKIPTGPFLRAVLENNLKEAVARADEDNLRLLPEIVQYCHENLSRDCWGSSEIVSEFLESK